MGFSQDNIAAGIIFLIIGMLVIGKSRKAIINVFSANKKYRSPTEMFYILLGSFFVAMGVGFTSGRITLSGGQKAALAINVASGTSTGAYLAIIFAIVVTAAGILMASKPELVQLGPGQIIVNKRFTTLIIRIFGFIAALVGFIAFLGAVFQAGIGPH